MSTDHRMRLVVVGGFLGSGKTTLLERTCVGTGVQVVINDFGSHAPDLTAFPAFSAFGGGAIPLLGGCACCAGRGALIALLRKICGSRHRVAEHRVNTVVLETSGLADPAAIVAAVTTDPVLSSNVVLSEVVATVDAARGISDLIHEPLARRQIEVADRIVVTKADLVSVEQLRPVLATVHRLNPAAELSVSARAVPAPLPDFDLSDAHPLPDLDSIPQTDPLSCWIPLPHTVDWNTMAIWLGALIQAHRDRVLRIKGLVHTPAGPLVLHAARGHIGVPVRVDPIRARDSEAGLLLVLRDLDPDVVRRSWAVFDAAFSDRTFTDAHAASQKVCS